jgi:hypothetical protein
MTRQTIDYERLGVEACEAYTEGSESFADFVSTILSVAAPLHVLQTANSGERLEPLNNPLSIASSIRSNSTVH